MATDCIDSSTTATLSQGVSPEQFAKALANPTSVSVGEMSVSSHSISSLIELDKHLRKYGRRRRNPLACVGIGRAIPPGPCD